MSLREAVEKAAHVRHRLASRRGEDDDHLAYDPCGACRATDWSRSLTDAESAALGDVRPRGFTGHEHLDRVGLIHANGRLYDPRLGRYLSPDPAVSDPTHAQSWNGYAYVGNSPLSFTDPTGMARAGSGCNVGGVMCLDDGGGHSDAPATFPDSYSIQVMVPFVVPGAMWGYGSLWDVGYGYGGGLGGSFGWFGGPRVGYAAVNISGTIYRSVGLGLPNVGARPMDRVSTNPRSHLPELVHAARPPIRCDCVGNARVFIGNPKHIDPRDPFNPRDGGFSGYLFRVLVKAGTAAIDPYQWGDNVPKLRPYLPYIRGISREDGTVLFDGVTNTIGYEDWDSENFEDPRAQHRHRNPGMLLIERPDGTWDKENHRVRICLPAHWECPMEGHGKWRLALVARERQDHAAVRMPWRVGPAPSLRSVGWLGRFRTVGFAAEALGTFRSSRMSAMDKP